MSEITDNIDSCLRTREIAAKALLETIQFAKGKRLSEEELADLWREKSVSDPSLCKKGWYEPPPNGFSVLVPDEIHLDRLDFPTLRVTEMWSQSDIFWKDDQVAFFYASPVDKERGIVGDFCVSLYNGNNAKIIKHFKDCYLLGKMITDYAKFGMTFDDIYTYATTLFDAYGFQNTAKRIYDNMSTNIGHTMPWTNEEMTKAEKNVFVSGDWDRVKNMISGKRKFVEPGEQFRISENVIFSIEARLKNPSDENIPTPTFHFLVVFREGKKSIVDNFAEIFDFWGMDYFV